MGTAPVALLTFLTRGGEPKIIAASWVWIVCSRPAVLTAVLKRPLLDPFRPAEGRFTVNYLTDGQLERLAWQELLAREDGRLPAGCGFTFDPGGGNPDAGIAECPVRLECLATPFRPSGDGGHLCGKVTAIRLEGKVYGPEGRPDLFQVQPFARRGPGAALTTPVSAPAAIESLPVNISFS